MPVTSALFSTLLLSFPTKLKLRKVKTTPSGDSITASFKRRNSWAFSERARNSSLLFADLTRDASKVAGFLLALPFETQVSRQSIWPSSPPSAALRRKSSKRFIPHPLKCAHAAGLVVRAFYSFGAAQVLGGFLQFSSKKFVECHERRVRSGLRIF